MEDPQNVDSTVYVGNVASSITEETIAALFAHCGKVSNVRISGNKDPSYQSRFAFVEFEDKSHAHTACMLNGLNLAERTIRVAMAKTPANKPATGLAAAAGMLNPALFANGKPNNEPERVSRTIHMSGVDVQVSEQHLAQYFSVCGEVTAVRISGDGFNSTRYAWVEFAVLESAYGALSLDGQVLGSQQLRISPSKSAIQSNGLIKPGVPGVAGATLPGPPGTAATGNVACTVHVAGVDRNVQETDLLQFFQGHCGPVHRVQIAGNLTQPTRFAFVEFESPESTQKAIALSGTPIGGFSVVVNPAKSPILNVPPGATQTQLPPPPPITDASAINQVHNATAAINARFTGRRERDKSPRRERDRSRERSSRDRDRSRERSRERSRDRDRHHRERSRERERDRSRDRSRDRGHDRRKDR
mmetsp:Transcript_25823/g.31314  ORF Transcript_25823/g.31314 Transcript_25823/m.31314 type:complete len:417 (+) Transcript_25823:113-1363(+)